MKTFYLFLLISFSSICLVSCGNIDKTDTVLPKDMVNSNTQSSSDTEKQDILSSSSTEKQDTNSSSSTAPAAAESYWFPSGTKVQSVNLKSTYDLEIPDELDLLITPVADYPNGNLYGLWLDWKNNYFEQTEYDGWDRRNLGYFYVEEDSIYRVRVITEEFSPLFDPASTSARTDAITEDEDITTWNEEDFKSKGSLVCQNNPMEDKLDKKVKGFHESIEIDNNNSIYKSYYNRVETDFYENFIWERGKGLVHYWSGYGAASMHIEISQ